MVVLCGILSAVSVFTLVLSVAEFLHRGQKVQDTSRPYLWEMN